MSVDFEKLDYVMDKVGDAPVGYGLRFRQNGRPFTTLHFERTDGNGASDGVHMYVMVDKDYLPLAMTLVHPPTPCVQYCEVARDGDDCKRLVTELYGFLCQLSAWARTFRRPSEQPGAAEALANATERAKRLEANAMKKAA